jgi:hypothetical protein
MTIKILRSQVTATPPSIGYGQLAYSEASQTLFVGDHTLAPIGIAGAGLFAKLASPAFTGVPTAPTAAGGTNTTQIATTAFVTAAVAGAGGSSVWGGITGTLSSQTDLQTALNAKANLASPTFTGVPAVPTAAGGTNTTQAASCAFVHGEILTVINGAPGALDTLKELADAINDDASYAATITTALGLKAPIASPTFTGTPAGPTAAAATNTTQLATTAFVQAALDDGTF